MSPSDLQLFPGAEEFGQEAHADTGGTRTLIGAGSARPACARDVEVHPGRLSDERREETGCGRSAAAPPTGVLQVRDRALHRATVLRGE